ncbi:MAG: hypothetical protein HQM16_03435, partial [Deltaproteobacteria bacterium]|nr:hypothetical protein [Deltaproteobacteria bacterium]
MKKTAYVIILFLVIMIAISLSSCSGAGFTLSAGQIFGGGQMTGGDSSEMGQYDEDGDYEDYTDNEDYSEYPDPLEPDGSEIPVDELYEMDIEELADLVSFNSSISNSMTEEDIPGYADDESGTDFENIAYFDDFSFNSSNSMTEEDIPDYADDESDTDFENIAYFDNVQANSFAEDTIPTDEEDIYDGYILTAASDEMPAGFELPFNNAASESSNNADADEIPDDFMPDIPAFADNTFIAPESDTPPSGFGNALNENQDNDNLSSGATDTGIAVESNTSIPFIPSDSPVTTTTAGVGFIDGDSTETITAMAGDEIPFNPQADADGDLDPAGTPPMTETDTPPPGVTNGATREGDIFEQPGRGELQRDGDPLAFIPAPPPKEDDAPQQGEPQYCTAQEYQDEVTRVYTKVDGGSVVANLQSCIERPEEDMLDGPPVYVWSPFAPTKGDAAIVVGFAGADQDDKDSKNTIISLTPDEDGQVDVGTKELNPDNEKGIIFAVIVDKETNYAKGSSLSIIGVQPTASPTKPASKDTTKPASKDTTKPAAKDTTKPAAKDTTKPASKDTTKPASK